MGSPVIGQAPCPYCRKVASVTVMKTGRVCLTCNACKLQAFARGDESDELIRDTTSAAPPAAAPAPAPDPAPAAAPAPKPGFLWGAARW